MTVRIKLKSYLIAKLESSALLRDSFMMICSKENGLFSDLTQYVQHREKHGDDIRNLGIEMTASRSHHSHGNYRWRSGCFVGRHTIAKKLFDYPADVTEEEIYFMEEIVGLIETLMDSMMDYRYYNHQIEKERKAIEEQERRQKEFDEAARWVAHQQKEKEMDHLYLMRHVNGLTKIGRSVNPKAREKTLQAEDPRLELIFTAENLGWLEGKFHKILHEERVRGEWFRLEEHRIDWIKFYCELKEKEVGNEH